MKMTIIQETITSGRATAVRSRLFLSASLALATCIASLAQADDAETHYRQINLVSDISGIAQVQDTNLVNAWGISFHPTFPFWVSDNGAGVTTLYSVTNDASGVPHGSATPSTAIGIPGAGPAVISIPGAGNVTGQVANNSTEFNSDIFLFVSEDGTISGWRPGIGTAAETLATRTNAIYKGVTLATVGTNTVLLAANFHEGTLDVYDGNSQLLGQFADQRAPEGYAPFNVQNLNGVIFVTFAKQDAAKRDDVAGRGRGLIDTFDISTGKFRRFAAGRASGGNVREMNSPWGLAVAPASFG